VDLKVGRRPAPQCRIKLTLQWIVFTDQWGNFVLIDPNRNKPLWLDESRRPPTVYVAATDQEMKRALEEMLFRYTHSARVTPEHLRLVDRVERALEDHFNQGRGRSKRAA
jgi:hypothetical protein